MTLTAGETAGPAATKKRKLTLCGSFGLGNTGDEALPHAIMDLARAHGIGLEVNLLSRYDEPTLASAIGLGKNSKHRRQELIGQQCLIIGGGVIEPGPMSVLFRCAPYIEELAPSHVTLFAAAVEAGVYYPLASRLRIRRILRGMGPLLVRDELSADVLGRLLPHSEIEVVGDAVLWLEPDGAVSRHIEGLDRFVAVSLTGRWSAPGWYAWISDQLRRLAESLDAALVFVPFSWLDHDDRLEHRKVCEVLRFLYPHVDARPIDEVLRPAQVLGVIRRSTLTVGMRLHACVMSFAQRVPFIALAYHPKIYGFAKTVGWENFIIPRRLPQRQTSRAYGYDFGDITADEQLADVAAEALRFRSFERLDELRGRIAKAFLEVLDHGR